MSNPLCCLRRDLDLDSPPACHQIRWPPPRTSRFPPPPARPIGERTSSSLPHGKPAARKPLRPGVRCKASSSPATAAAGARPPESHPPPSPSSLRHGQPSLRPSILLAQCRPDEGGGGTAGSPRSGWSIEILPQSHIKCLKFAQIRMYLYLKCV